MAWLFLGVTIMSSSLAPTLVICYLYCIADGAGCISFRNGQHLRLPVLAILLETIERESFDGLIATYLSANIINISPVTKLYYIYDLFCICIIYVLRVIWSHSVISHV